MVGPDIQLITPESAADWQDARLVLRDYAASLNVDLGFQGFDAELDSLPSVYAPPGGLMLLALVDGAVAGSGAFRPLPDADYPNACEMKRLFVRPAFRRFGLGRILAQALMDRATEAGYSSMLLDTLDDMEAARGLYESLGFVEVPPFYFNPVPGAHYLKAELGVFRPSYFG
ncbi:GNAT family N-acetyltransferase [Roseateles sp.]|uniref:GNAT family N-acetyltransferase n=1 Tax=Roseateles sp. TaxID=1971397 RepID=UPI003BA9B45E